MSKFTPWFKPAKRGGENPHRRGVFQTAVKLNPGLIFYRYCSGKQWGACANTADEAFRRRKERDGTPNFWRGLAEKPQ